MGWGSWWPGSGGGWRRWWRRLPFTEPRPVAREGVDREAIERELEHHIEERFDALIAQGVSPEEARREACRRFGDLRRIQQECETVRRSRERGMRRGMSTTELVASILEDLRNGARLVRNAPGLFAALILTIGLGVGANVAVFSVTDAVVLRPMPYEDPEELFFFDGYDAEEGRLYWPSAHQALTWYRQDELPGFSRLALYARTSFVRTDTAEPVSVRAHAVSHDWLDALGVGPALGRSFSAAEARPGASGVAMVSHGFWRSRLGADPEAVGRALELDERTYTVIGVMPPGFEFPSGSELWIPLGENGSVVDERPEYLDVVGRVSEGLGPQQAQQRLDELAASLQQADPQPRGWGVRLRPIDSFRVDDDVEQALWVLTGAVCVMLLIAMVNGANLLLVHASTRKDELAIRRALGASRGRLLRQLVTEAAVPMTLGGVAAVILARLGLAGIVDRLPREVTGSLVGQIGLDHRVLLYALAVTGLVGLLVGLVPGLRMISSGSSRPSVGRASSTGAEGRVRNALVVAEVALSIALLVGAGLLVRSFVRLTSVDPGYEPDRLVYLALSLPERTYPDGARRLQFQRRLRDSLAGTPGIGAVSMASGVPPRAGFHFNVAPQVEGEEPKPWGQRVWLPNSDVDPTFFETLRVPIVAGRNFTSADTPESGNVIIDRGFASFLFGDDYPIGRRFRIREQSPWLMVVGLVEDVKLMGRDDRQSPYEIFAPYPHDGAPEYVQLVMRTASAPDAMLPLIRQEVRELDPQLPLAELATGRALLAESVDEPRFFLLLMSTLAAIGLALAALGTYGVLAFTVTRRSRELGVRAALGAGTGRLRMMVLGDGVRLAAVGAAAGLLMSLAFGRVMEVLLFQVEPTDTMTLVTVPIVIIGTAALASWIPARRATRVDPVEVLRSE